VGRSRTKSLPQLGMPKDMQKKSTTVAHSDEALSARDQDLESGLVKTFLLRMTVLYQGPRSVFHSVHLCFEETRRLKMSNLPDLQKSSHVSDEDGD
jgi:hypothetical protein